MSYMINEHVFDFEFQEDNFVMVLKNDVYDMGVLLYREFFMKI